MLLHSFMLCQCAIYKSIWSDCHAHLIRKQADHIMRPCMKERWNGWQRRKWNIFFNGHNDDNRMVLMAEEITASIIVLNCIWFVPSWCMCVCFQMESNVSELISKVFSVAIHAHCTVWLTHSLIHSFYFLRRWTIFTLVDVTVDSFFPRK